MSEPLFPHLNALQTAAAEKAAAAAARAGSLGSQAANAAGGAIGTGVRATGNVLNSGAQAAMGGARAAGGVVANGVRATASATGSMASSAMGGVRAAGGAIGTGLKTAAPFVGEAAGAAAVVAPAVIGAFSAHDKAGKGDYHGASEDLVGGIVSWRGALAGMRMGAKVPGGWTRFGAMAVGTVVGGFAGEKVGSAIGGWLIPEAKTAPEAPAAAAPSTSPAAPAAAAPAPTSEGTGMTRTIPIQGRDPLKVAWNEWADVGGNSIPEADRGKISALVTPYKDALGDPTKMAVALTELDAKMKAGDEHAIQAYAILIRAHDIANCQNRGVAEIKGFANATQADAYYKQYFPYYQKESAKIIAAAGGAAVAAAPGATAPDASATTASPSTATGGRSWTPIEKSVQFDLETLGLSTGQRGWDVSKGVEALDGKNGQQTTKAISDFRASKPEYANLSAEDLYKEIHKAAEAKRAAATAAAPAAPDASAPTISPALQTALDQATAALGEKGKSGLLQDGTIDATELERVKQGLTALQSSLPTSADKIPDSVRTSVTNILAKLAEGGVTGTANATDTDKAVSASLQSIRQLITPASAR